MGMIVAPEDLEGRNCRPQFSVEYHRFKEWYTPERFRVMWEEAKKLYRELGYSSPALSVVWDIGISRRTVSRWLNGTRPSPMALFRLEWRMRVLLGDDWRDRIDGIAGEKEDS